MPSSCEPHRNILVRRNGPVKASRGNNGVEEELTHQAPQCPLALGWELAHSHVLKGGCGGLWVADDRTPRCDLECRAPHGD